MHSCVNGVSDDCLAMREGRGGGDPGSFFRRGCTTKKGLQPRLVCFFLLAEYYLFKKAAGHLRGLHTPCTLPLDPPLEGVVFVFRILGFFFPSFVQELQVRDTLKKNENAPVDE